MNPLHRALLVGGMAALPGLLFIAYNTLLFRGEYFYVFYALAGGVFATASFVLGALVTRLFRPATSRWQVILLLFGAIAAAWGLALALQGILSLTPLCVGQDNGDGSNDVALCLLQYGLVSLFSTPPVLTLGLVCATVTGAMLRRSPQNDS